MSQKFKIGEVIANSNKRAFFLILDAVKEPLRPFYILQPLDCQSQKSFFAIGSYIDDYFSNILDV
jgi:hypothetical protein